MKKVYLLLILTALYGGAEAQYTQYLPSTYMPKNVLPDKNILSADIGGFNAGSPGHSVSANFPYTSLSTVSGGVTQQTFSGTLDGKISSPVYLAGVKLEIDRKHNAYDIGLGYFKEEGGDHGIELKAGYGYIIPLGRLLLLKPSMDLYGLFGKNKMGSIDNSQKEISLLGHVAHDQFTVNVDDGAGSTYEETYDADRLDVNYRRFIFLCNPKLVLSTRQVGLMSFSLEAGYMVQLLQRCTLQFEQVNTSSHYSKSAGSVVLDNNGVFSGPYAAVNIGFCLK